MSKSVLKSVLAATVMTAALALGACGGENGSEAGGEAASGAGKATQASIGQPFTVGPSEVTIENAAAREQVGAGTSLTKAEEGVTLLVVRYALKNVGDEPLGSFDRPELTLIDPDGAEYIVDTEMRPPLMTEADGGGVDNKRLHVNLDPGATTRDAEVIAISKAGYDPATWVLVVSKEQDRLGGPEEKRVSLKPAG